MGKGKPLWRPYDDDPVNLSPISSPLFSSYTLLRPPSHPLPHFQPFLSFVDVFSRLPFATAFSPEFDLVLDFLG